MSANQHSMPEEGQRRHRHEGPQKHIVAFAFSMVLTLIAFAAVSAGGVNKSYVYILLITMAILQVLIQLGIWMHMKDRGHAFPILFIFGGATIAFTCIAMALFWVWW